MPRAGGGNQSAVTPVCCGSSTSALGYRARTPGCRPQLETRNKGLLQLGLLSRPGAAKSALSTRLLVLPLKDVLAASASVMYEPCMPASSLNCSVQKKMDALYTVHLSHDRQPHVTGNIEKR